MLLQDEALERVTTTQVGRGLYLLKYVSGATSGPSPVAMARPLAGNEPFIEVISAPGVVSGFLSRPGDALVVRAERQGELSIKLIRQNIDASFEASFRLEFVVPGGGEVDSVLGRAPEVAIERGCIDAASSLRVCAHVARRGDVEVPAAQWVAGPGAPAAIEGIEIRGALPEGVRIYTQVLVPTNPPRWLEWAPEGVYAGTRGRAMPLVGLRLRLGGEAAARFVIRGEALFLGAAVVSKRAREVEFVGSGAADPLVGFRLDLESASPVAADVKPPKSRVTASQAAMEHQAGSRVRVFRAASLT